MQQFDTIARFGQLGERITALAASIWAKNAKRIVPAIIDRWDWQSLEPAPIPEGIYLCRVREAHESETRHGHKRWAIAFEIAAGDHAGRLAAWDAIVFSPRGMARLRRFLHALGCLGAERPVELVGAEALVEIRRVTFPTPTEEGITRTEVPYGGITRTEVPYGGIWHRDDPTVRPIRSSILEARPRPARP